MRRPCSWAGGAAPAWMLAAFLLLALATPVDALESAGVTLTSTYNIVAMPESCSYVRKRFASPILDYQASWTSNATVPLNCTLEISQLFLHDACSALSSKSWSVQLTGCPFKASGNNSSCEAAVSHGRPSIWDGSTSWWSTVQPNAPATTIFDASGVCGTAPFLGYFYIHNSCNMTLSFTLTVTTQARSHCHFPANVFRMVKNVLALLLRGFFTFVMWMPCLGLALAAVLLVALAFQSYRQRLMLPPTVEMTAPVPSEIRINAGEAAAKDYTSLLGGGTDGPSPSGTPVYRQ